jgi:hypothetical protein
MAKSKKKKKPQTPPSIARQLEITKTYFDKYSVVVRKTLQLLELDPALFDQFTKKQKLKMMGIKSDPPRVKAQEGHTIPRHYIRKVQQEMYDFIKYYPVNGDRELNLSYMDFLTYGLSFILNAMVRNSEEEIEHKEIFQLIATKANMVLDSSHENPVMDLWQYIRYIVTSISKINIRIYGFEWHWDGGNYAYRVGGRVTISCVSPKKTYFTYKDTVRPAYQVICGQFLLDKPKAITIPYNQVIEDSDQIHLLEVFVQSHAFARLKERIDVLPAAIRTMCLHTSLINCQTTTLKNGQCVIQLIEINTGIIGYLPFTIIKNRLFILSFLPICSQNAPEGLKLQELLGISRKETEYLGMDKLSFFTDTDFEAIPRMKQAVTDAGLWHLTKLPILQDYVPQNPMSTSTVIRFFQTDRTHEEVLSEIEEKY